MEFLLIIIFCFLFIKLIFSAKKKELFPGKVYKYTYKGYKAKIIIDDTIKVKRNKIYYDGQIVFGKELAKACAVGMYSTQWLWKLNKFSKTYNKNSEVKEFVVLFLAKTNFEEACKTVGYELDGALAYATKFSKKYPHDGPYGCVINASELKRTEIWAYAPIHEYIHVLSHFYTLNWDHEHKIWKQKLNGVGSKNKKNLGQKAAEQTYIILNIN